MTTTPAGEALDSVMGVTTPIAMKTNNGTTVAYLLSNTNLQSATYDQTVGAVQMSVQNSEPVGAVNLVLPRSAIRGSPALLLDGNAADLSYYQDENNYYVFYSCPQGTHTVSIGGQDAIPEFSAKLPALVAAVLMVAVVSRKSWPGKEGRQTRGI
jgi:hypothetical protein